ncbi:uncharacterized protein LOC123412633 [Hordeum vulgare subsp. vulgare]|uniref:Predicted protein n=1 Tax=Hordeum vulgare subsp. vulgare TaxID=112509 RepID=F2EK93_HORVV|nr:uncharacterized protein LOC123412633 [Hordeum vulgare subsp. vulgare]BAK07765.1 predicted protein [Hordeum vulgare subsp. vulgare]
MARYWPCTRCRCGDREVRFWWTQYALQLLDEMDTQANKNRGKKQGNKTQLWSRQQMPFFFSPKTEPATHPGSSLLMSSNSTPTT